MKLSFLRQKLYLPAVFILSVMVFLLVLISLSTYRNLDMARKNALILVGLQGEMLIDSIESVLLSGEKQEFVEEIVNRISTNPTVNYIKIRDREGDRAPFTFNDSGSGNDASQWPPSLSFETPHASRIHAFKNGAVVYESVKLLVADDIAGRADTVVMVGLNMDTYDAVRKSDLHHAFLMLGIVGAVGGGALFFFFVIQKFYVLDLKLRQTRNYAELVVDNMANGLVSIDLHGNITSHNTLALGLLGIEKSDARGNDLKSVLDFSGTGINETLNTGALILDREVSFKTAGGNAVPLSLSVTPIRTGLDDISGAVIVIRDLREIKKLQEKVRNAEKMAAVGRLAAGVAHEIRNPLSSIRGFAGFLSHALADRPDDKAYADIMVREVDRINGVVTDLLTLSVPGDVNFADADIREIADHALKLVEDEAKATGVRIENRIGSGMTEIEMDSGQITQVLLNLLLNSMSAVERGGNIFVDAVIDDDNKVVEIAVEDDGCGIMPDHRDNVFDPFYTTKDYGTGLGLSIVRNIIRNHGGSITFQSPPEGKNKGTVFVIDIPLSPDISRV